MHRAGCSLEEEQAENGLFLSMPGYQEPALGPQVLQRGGLAIFSKINDHDLPFKLLGALFPYFSFLYANIGFRTYNHSFLQH